MKEILATFITIAVALRSVSATTTLCVNGNNQIRKLYIDGEDFTKKLKGRGTYKTCDCVEIPVNSGVIAIEAMSRKDPTVRTIQSCVDSNPEIYDNWRCLPIGEKRMDSMPNWMNPDYNDEKFEAPKYKKCYETCRGVKDLTCKMSKCFWTKRIAWVPRYDRNAKDIIRCRLRQCAEGCYTCATAGPGKCDNGQCILGLGTNSKTKQTICNSK